MAELSITVNLSIRTCGNCGIVYAVPSWLLGSSRCPICAERIVSGLRESVEHVERVNRSLRGALTKMKKSAEKKAI